MRFFTAVTALVQTLALGSVALNFAHAQVTAELLSRLDQTARSFTGATANIRVINHISVINEDDTQIGTIAVKRYSSREMRFLIKFTGQQAQQIALQEGTIQVYYPNINTIREYGIGKYKDLTQKLLLVGFGMPGRELAANYEINNLGDERVESQESTHLQLTPRAAEVSKQLSRVDLWISKNTNCPVQQKFYASSGDYRLVTFSDVKVNPKLPVSALDLPKRATRERMN